MKMIFLKPKAIAYAIVFVLALFAVTVSSGMAQAQQNDGGDAWKSKPHYNEETGSYYQMIQGGKVNWSEAQGRAQRFKFKGRRGRLAIVDTPELFDWIRAKFIIEDSRPQRGVGLTNTWIGLRYWCSVRELIWTDGSQHPFTAYAPWDNPWYGGGIRCENARDMPYMGVYLSGETDLWRAQGNQKEYWSYIVEYPPE